MREVLQTVRFPHFRALLAEALKPKFIARGLLARRRENAHYP
jgi:hypothetical protein